MLNALSLDYLILGPVSVPDTDTQLQTTPVVLQILRDEKGTWQWQNALPCNQFSAPLVSLHSVSITGTDA